MELDLDYKLILKSPALWDEKTIAWAEQQQLTEQDNKRFDSDETSN
jgi:hypothetical protein